MTKDFIDSRLGYVLSQMGKPVKNAALWMEELGSNAPVESDILAKDTELLNVESNLKKQGNAYSTALSHGFDTGLGFKLSISDESYKTISSFADWVDRVYSANAQSQIFPSGIPIVDQIGVYHSISHPQLTALLVPFGATCLAAYQIKPK